MKIAAWALSVGLGVVACGGPQQAPTVDPRTEVQQLMTLFQEARPKFVVQKQEMEQASDCGRATRLREAVDAMAAEAAMQPEKNETLTLVQMELQQAEKTCLAK